MSAIIQTLNAWGENFFSFAWPMLWQSSLLIALVFAFDALFARRVRAAVRYALWIAVLVKLLLPPTLALPTSAAWWLWPAKPALVPVMSSEVVTFDGPVTMPPVTVPQTAPFVPPPPELSVAGWTVLALFVVGAALLLWLALRWLRVAAKVHCVASFDDLAPALEEVGQLSRLRRTPRLKLVEDVQSPAVYGLFRPTILLPRALVEKLSARQLRAVLLHEAIHLRRGDVWVNCAQTLLQIAYWWHPLLWLANARIRRLREEAVDDAVMLTLHNDADTYAPTLLEVAKFSFRRPFGLALIGILESRSALRRRIERLVDFRPPRRPGLTFLSLCGILAFSAVTLPMGCGRQASTTDSVLSGVGPAEKKLTMIVEPQIFIRNLKVQAGWTLEQDPNEALLDVMDGEGVDCTSSHEIAFNAKTGEVTTQNTPEQLEIFRRVIEQLNRADGKCALPLRSTAFHRKSILIRGQFFWMTADELKKITSDAMYHRKRGDDTAHWTADAEQFDQIQKRIEQLGLQPFTQPRIQTLHGMAADMYIGNYTNWVDFECYPLIYENGISLAFKAESDSVFMQDALQKTNHFEVNGRETLDDNGGIIVRTEKTDSAPTNLVLVINVKTIGEAPASNSNASAEISGQTASALNQALAEERKAAHLEMTAQSKVTRSKIHPHPVIDAATGLPVSASSLSSPINPGALEMREFQVDPHYFPAELQNATGIQVHDRNISTALKQLFAKVGVDLSPPKQIYYGDRLGTIFVHATPQDLDIIEKTIIVLNERPPLIHIKARFLEVPKQILAAANSFPAAFTNGGVLPNPEFQVLWHELKYQNGVQELAEPEVTTIASRQVKMRATITQPIVATYEAVTHPTNMNYVEAVPSTNLYTPQTWHLETGPAMNVMPRVLSDGYTLNLHGVVTDTKFFGYADASDLPPRQVDAYWGGKVSLPIVLPLVQDNEAIAQNTLYDGQTLVLFLASRPNYMDDESDEKMQERVAEAISAAESKKVLIVLVTATLIDEAGNRVHSDSEMPFGQNSVPPPWP